MRLALYVCLKNICDGVGGQDESNGTTLDPPLFWLDIIFNVVKSGKSNTFWLFNEMSITFMSQLHFVSDIGRIRRNLIVVSWL